MLYIAVRYRDCASIVPHHTRTSRTISIAVLWLLCGGGGGDGGAVR